MRRHHATLLALSLVLTLGAESASAQGLPNNQMMPNFYNRQNQPLSPYLNLLRGGNAAANYYYGVRPGTPAGGYMGVFGYGAANSQMMLQKQSLSTLAVPFDEIDDELTRPEAYEDRPLSPTGHPTNIGGAFGFSGPPVGYSMGGRGPTGPNASMGAGGGGAGRRPAAGGAGGNRPRPQGRP
jgi:hypothetical protein